MTFVRILGQIEAEFACQMECNRQDVRPRAETVEKSSRDSNIWIRSSDGSCERAGEDIADNSLVIELRRFQQEPRIEPERKLSKAHGPLKDLMRSHCCNSAWA